ncbi:MAG: peptide-methionine (S)-S-oxide reductase, partial [Proteobacteria bacterium]|nr:peptide-methionine (S)-S-oxide reductase [Pseudomonadota bacterium]
RREAEAVIRELEGEGVWDRPVVTRVEPFMAFYRAEDYHQEFYRQNPEHRYCQLVITPKVTKFREHFFARLKAGAEGSP